MAETATPPEPKTTKQPEKIPIAFTLDEKVFDAASIKPSTFASFSDFVAEAHRMTQPAAFSARLLRVGMSKQVNDHINSATVPLTPRR